MIEPKLRLKADDGSRFPDWERKKIVNVSDRVKVGFVGTCECYYTDESGIRLYRTGNLQKGRLVEDDMKYVLKKFHEANKKSQLHKWDILIARHGNSGNAVLYDSDEEANCLNIVIIRPDLKVVNPKFMVENINSASVEKQVCRLKNGSTQVVLNTKAIEDLDVGIPCLPEQQKIAEFLSTIDTVIAKQKETVSAWEERKKGVMQKLFSQEVRFKADDGSDFPEWEEKKLGDVCEYRRGQSVGINYVGTENMNQNFSGVDSLDSTNEVKGVMYCDGDTLMSNIRTYLKKTWKADRNGVCSTDVLVFHPVNVDSDFLHCNISSEKFISYVMTGVKGSKMPRGDKSHIMEYDMSIPSLPEQQKIADCLSLLGEVIEKQKATLSAWEELKKGLLQQMFV